MISFLPGMLDGLACPFAYRFQGFGAIPKIAMAGIGTALRMAIPSRVWEADFGPPAAVYLCTCSTSWSWRSRTGQLQIGHKAKSGFAAARESLTLTYRGKPLVAGRAASMTPERYCEAF
jgi:hypothetical protein